MKAIDLTCLIAAPLAVGLLMSGAGLAAAVAAILAWNLAAWLPECLLLLQAQSLSSVLRCLLVPPPVSTFFSRMQEM